MLQAFAFFVHLVKVSIKASMSLRGAFLIEAGLMLANNLIFFSMWWIFFNQFEHVGGWYLKDMLTVVSVGSGAYGLAQICFGEVKNLSRIIVNGDLDPFMTQPKNVLIHVISSRSRPKGWGHLMTCATLMVLGDLLHFQTIVLIIISVVCGCIVFTATAIIVHSLTFWLGSIQNLAQKYYDSLFLFALYPTNIYSGLLQMMMFTVIPAGIIGYLPVEMIREFTWTKLGLLLLSSLTFWFLAFFTFTKGLKRYESGNQFGTRI